MLPSKQGDLSYRDWAVMLSGLMADTPLGQVVSIRSEKDPDILKNYTRRQRQIRADWNRYKMSKGKISSQEEIRQFKRLETMLKNAFGDKGG